ncbi:Dabb family protein [Candidatus Liberibacter sp.]|uniref:Dabb family protein n=1 Tax=Candidatus Liberibacter sp. TaxID=34022 RepID=UPI0015F4E2C1|nr:Dabb family protein [Candidatus Liberibacter sp.]MBA5723609.1 Dabb family protein [Candidatus Liberibacter sp.]
MLRHIVFFTVSPENYEDVCSGLSDLIGIPHVRLLEIGKNLRIDSWSQEIDLVVYGEFDDQESLDSFKKHPLYQSAVSKVVNLRKLRFAVDYDTDSVVKSPR